MAASEAQIYVSDLLLDPGEFDESSAQLASLANTLETEQHINSHLQGQAESHSEWQAKAAASDQKTAALSGKLEEALTHVDTLQRTEAGWHAERDHLQQQVSASAAQLAALHQVVSSTQQRCLELAAGGGVTPPWALGVRGSVIEELHAQSEALLTLQQADWQHNAQLAELRASYRALQARSQAEHDARSSIVPVDHTPLIAELRGALEEQRQSTAAAERGLQVANAELLQLQQELDSVKSADALELASLRAEAAAASEAWQLERQQLQQSSASSQAMVQELQARLQLSVARVAELESASAAVQIAQRDTELHAEAQQEAMSHLAKELAQAQTALADAAQAQVRLVADSAAEAAAATQAREQQAAELAAQHEASVAQSRSRLDGAAAEWSEQQQQLQEQLQAAQTAAAAASAAVVELASVRAALQRAEEELQAEADAGAALEAANHASTAELLELRQEMLQYEGLKAEHAVLVQSAELLQQQVLECEAQLSAERTARAAAEGTLASLQEASGSQESAAAASWAVERSSLQSQLSAAVAAADTLAVRLAEAEEGHEEAECQLEQQQQQVQRVTAELNAARAQLEQLREKHAAVVVQAEAAAAAAAQASSEQLQLATAAVDQHKHELGGVQAKTLQLEADVASRYMLYTYTIHFECCLQTCCNIATTW
jgi:hypothetical protein